MGNFLIAAVIVIGGWWLVRQFANAQPKQVRGLIRKVGGGAILAFGALMAMRGNMNLATPMFVLGLGLMGQDAMLANGLPWQKKADPQPPRMATSLLLMELNPATGAMDGDVLGGPLRGRRLSSLTPDELRALWQLCAAAPDQSRGLLEAWMDRSRPGWREAWGGAGRARPPLAGMSRKEAFAVLGLEDGASEDSIRAAHRRLMKDFHPDKGGTDYLAAKINEAKDVLLQEAGPRT